MTGAHRIRYHPVMIETAFLLAGLGFSIHVYLRTIKTRHFTPGRKALHFLLTTVGITGTLFLLGVLIADTGAELLRSVLGR